MQDVHLTCPSDHLLVLVEQLSHQVQAQSEEVSLLDYGHCSKSGTGYIVVEWTDEVNEAFLAHLDADPAILDYSVYSVPCSTDEYPFGYELTCS